MRCNNKVIFITIDYIFQQQFMFIKVYIYQNTSIWFAKNFEVFKLISRIVNTKLISITGLRGRAFKRFEFYNIVPFFDFLWTLINFGLLACKISLLIFNNVSVYIFISFIFNKNLYVSLTCVFIYLFLLL